jgi:predicted acetyltransferase
VTNLKLVSPQSVFKASYLSYIKELGEEERYPFPLDFDHSDFEAMLQRNDDFEQGVQLPAGYVPSSTWWLVQGASIIGVSNLRHFLNDDIAFVGGHIGLGIRPSCRRKGFSKKLLELTLQQALLRNMREVHIHCYSNNVASKAMIISCGGVLDSEVELDSDLNVEKKTLVSRYRLLLQE